MTSTLIAPYRVADAFDVAAPVVSITQPTSTLSQTTRVVFTGPASHRYTVSGQVTDASTIASVLVNGITATLNGSNFSTPIVLTNGINFIDVVATDVAGNLGFTSTTLYAAPDYAIALSVNPTVTRKGQSVVAQMSLTTTEDLSVTVNLVSAGGGLTFTSASNGAVVAANLITWTGVVRADAPTQIVVTGTANAVVTPTLLAVAVGANVQPRFASVGLQFLAACAGDSTHQLGFD